MNKASILFVLVLLLGSVSLARSEQRRGFGLGIVLGSPTAITAKSWQNPSRAVDFGLGYWLVNYVQVYADYLFHFPKAFARMENPAPEFSPYIGIGGALVIANSSNPYRGQSSVDVSLRIPLGLEWLPPTAPLGVFLEIVPGISFIPGIAANLGAGIGIRYYF